ncbi:hypothetical protein AB4144_55800, partial [Rhizobiaceae sp. 2RAB30]
MFASDFKRSSEEAAVIFSDLDGTLPSVVDIGLTYINSSIAQNSYLAAANHLYGTGDLTFRYGIEGGTIDYRSNQTTLTYI